MGKLQRLSSLVPGSETRARLRHSSSSSMEKQSERALQPLGRCRPVISAFGRLKQNLQPGLYIEMPLRKGVASVFICQISGWNNSIVS